MLKTIDLTARIGTELKADIASLLGAAHVKHVPSALWL